MKMIVVTTITSVLDVDSLESEHSVAVDDQDGLSEISKDALGSLLLGAIRSTDGGIREMFPRVDASANRIDSEMRCDFDCDTCRED